MCLGRPHPSRPVCRPRVNPRRNRKCHRPYPIKFGPLILRISGGVSVKSSGSFASIPTSFFRRVSTSLNYHARTCRQWRTRELDLGRTIFQKLFLAITRTINISKSPTIRSTRHSTRINSMQLCTPSKIPCGSWGTQEAGFVHHVAVWVSVDSLHLPVY